jgi:hypothetical protein
MSETLGGEMTYVIVGLLCLAVGAGAMFAYMKPKQVKAIADALKGAVK